MSGGDNSFQVTVNDGVPHVVFQFQNIPVSRRMEASDADTIQDEPWLTGREMFGAGDC
jgi:hypothetical protein